MTPQKQVQYVHQQNDPHAPAEPYVHQEYPKHGFHPGLGLPVVGRHPLTHEPIFGSHNSVIFKDAEHEAMLKAQLADGPNGLHPDDWRDNPQYFGKEQPVSAAVAAQTAADENAALKLQLEQMKAQLAALQTAPQGRGRRAPDPVPDPTLPTA